MLVRYRTNSSCTLSNFQTDLNNIILGNVTTVNDLSAGADTTRSQVFGTYPSGTPYARVNGTSYTYSKVHNTVGSKTHYFRLTFDSSKLTTIELSQSYTSLTDTLVNSTSATINAFPIPYDSYYPNAAIDIVVSNKLIWINNAQTGSFAIIDVGHNGISRSYTSQMLMCLQDMNNVVGYGDGAGATIPYTYNFDTQTYGSLAYSHVTQTPLKKWTPNSNVAVFETPVFLTNSSNGNVMSLLYGLYKIPLQSFAGTVTYKDSNNYYRIAYNDYALLVD